MLPLLAISLVSGLMSASSAQLAGKGNRTIARYNARLAEDQANDALARGAQDEHRHRRQVSSLISSQRASFAAQGVDVNSGSAADIQEDSRRLGEEDAKTIRMNAAREAMGFRLQGAGFRVSGDQANRESKREAIGTLISTGANLYGQAMRR